MRQFGREVESLFSIVDETIEVNPGLARSALERILSVSPANQRAAGLLAGLEADFTHGDPLRLVIEAAENLATQRMYMQSREVVAYVRKRYGTHAEAQAWLDGVQLLWDQ